MNEYEDQSYQCTGSEAALNDCTETGEFSCEADNADFAMAVRCGMSGDDNGGDNRGGDNDGGSMVSDILWNRLHPHSTTSFLLQVVASTHVVLVGVLTLLACMLKWI